MSADSLLDAAADLGVSVVQIADNLPLHELPPHELDALSARVTDRGITLEVGTRGLRRRHLDVYLRLTERVGAQLLRVVVDTADHRPAEDEIVQTIRDIIPDLERGRVRLAIENHDRFAADTLARIMERVDSTHVGVCFDTANCFGASEGPEAALERLGPWVMNLHVKDYVVRRMDHAMGFVIEGRPAGQGQLDVRSVLERLRDEGRDPNAILELWPPPDADLVRTVAKERAWAAASVEYLRTLIAD